MWRVPGRTANWGIWEAADATALHAAITSLPLFPYLDVEVIALEKDSSGRLATAVVRDRTMGAETRVRARSFVNVTGPWLDSVRRLDDPGSPPRQRSSEISLRNSLSGKALNVSVRTFPSDASDSATFPAVSSFGASETMRRS